ncbi:MAG: arsenic metallochaperone ArsD family protein [Oxalobacter sp.]|nr:arsenic metallochaperone ArsD family protein [Oxalobacter sp.]
MDIQIFGHNTAKSAALTRQCQLAAAKKGNDISVRKIANRDKLSELGTDELPVLAIDDIIKSAGRIPARHEIESWIDNITSAQHRVLH